jgi:hypothetical protein
MEMVPLVPAPVVVLLEEGLVGPGVDEATAAEVLSVHVGAASASGRTDKRESAAESMTEENGKGKKDREGGRAEENWPCACFCTLGVKRFHCSAQLSSTCLLLVAKQEQVYYLI